MFWAPVIIVCGLLLYSWRGHQSRRRKTLVRSLVFCTLIAVCLCCQAVRVVHAQADAGKAIKELQGKWRAVEIQSSGISAPKEDADKAVLEIKDDEWFWLSGGPVDVKSRMRLDPSKSPKEIDITYLDGPAKGSTFPGIYELEKGRLRICCSATKDPKDRPKEFKTKRGQLRELLVLERVNLIGSPRAQDSDAKDLARVVAPFVNETTQMVGHVDVKKVDIKKYFQTVFAFVGENNQEVNALRALALMVQEKLLKAGIRDVLGVVNVSNPQEGNRPEVVVVAPLGKNAEADELLQLIAKVPGFTAKVEHNNLVARFGPMKETPAKNRPEFSEGLEALQDKHVRIIVAPSAEVRQFAEQQKVNVPPPLRGVEITLLTRGVRWFGVGHDAMLTQHHVLQAKDARAAKDLKSQVDKGLAAQEKLPGSPELIKDLKQQGDRLTWTVNEKALTGMLLLQASAQVREAAAHPPSMNNLKQIGRALWNHHDAQRLFPARANFDQNGKPLLSWRVHILPYVEQQELYDQFKLDEPWDSPHNKKLIERMPRIYASPLSTVGKDGKTTFLAVTGEGAIFDGTKGLRATDVTDGTSNTIMVLEANDTKAVTWTQPEDFAIDTKDPLAGLVLKNWKGILVLFADGSVRSLSPTVQPATLRALFTRNGGEVVNPKDY